MHKSSLRKIDLIAAIAEKLEQGELKVNAKTKEIYGLSLRGIVEIVRNNPLLMAVFGVTTFCLGAALEPIIQMLAGTAAK